VGTGGPPRSGREEPPKDGQLFQRVRPAAFANRDPQGLALNGTDANVSFLQLRTSQCRVVPKAAVSRCSIVKPGITRSPRRRWRAAWARYPFAVLPLNNTRGIVINSEEAARARTQNRRATEETEPRGCHTNAGGKMAMSSEERTNTERARAQKQDAAFCERLQEAIKRGRESCPIGISQEPGTKRPIVADAWERSIGAITSSQVIR
jgi:hypothetical protein